MCVIYFSYKLDEYSPEDDEEEIYCYEILSKVNKKLAPIQQPVVASTASNKPQSIADHMRCCSGHHHHHH